MSGLFSVPIGGLKEGVHSYDFEIGDGFFEHFLESEVKKGDLVAEVTAYKRSSHVDFNIKINGGVMLSCDRCLGMFRQQVSCENRLLVKFGKDYDVNDPELFTIPADEKELDLKQYLYESILLSLPIQRIHPDDNKGEITCDREMLNKLKEHLVDEERGETDPRWEELKKLMNVN